MAKRIKRTRQTNRSEAVTHKPGTRPMAALRPIAWSAVVGAAFAVAVAGPAHADPTTVPDPGSRPMPAGQLRLPGQAPSQPASIAPVPGPLATLVMQAEIEVAILGERRTELAEQLTTAQATTSEAERAWRAAAERVAELRAAVQSDAEAAYKSANELSPYGGFGSDILDLGKLLPRTETPEDGKPQITPWDISRAEEHERTTFRAYGDALLAESGLFSQHATVEASFTQKNAALIKLKADNAQQLARIEAEREAYEQSQSGKYGKAGINVDGEASHPKALAAVRFALSQLRKPYEWGAEGPSTYDCSGLMWASYRSVGITLARVARDQYRTTTPIPVDQLLPGDLVFFGTNRSDWRTVHHVGMYIGDGKMVHSPSTGDVVKISTVWWSRFFGATRVIGAVPAPPVITPPTTQPPATTPPPASPAPPLSPLPRSTKPAPSPSPTPTEPESPTATPGSTTAPPPTQPESPPPSTQESASPSPTGSAVPVP